MSATFDVSPAVPSSPGARAGESAPPHVLLLVASLRVGGAERLVASLARHLASARWPVTVVSLYASFGTSIESDLRAANVPLVFLGKRRGFDPRVVPRLARILRSLRPDVVHTHGVVLRYAFPSVLFARRPPVVHTIHNLAHREDAPGILLNQVAFRAGVFPVAIGHAVAHSIRSLYRLEPRRLIPNGIPIDAFRRVEGARAEVRSELAIPLDAPVLLAVGRLMVQKNHRLLLDAFSSERLARLGAHLLLAGDGELRDELRRRAGELGLEERVHFLGVRQDVPRLLSASDVFVLSSSWEGNPLSVMEAMAASVPVVATEVGCVAELVPPEAGRLVPAGDRAALESALYALASNLPAAKAMGDAAARLARERFDERLMVRAYQALYREVAASRT